MLLAALGFLVCLSAGVGAFLAAWGVGLAADEHRFIGRVALTGVAFLLLSSFAACNGRQLYEAQKELDEHDERNRTQSQRQ